MTTGNKSLNRSPPAKPASKRLSPKEIDQRLAKMGWKKFDQKMHEHYLTEEKQRERFFDQVERIAGMVARRRNEEERRRFIEVIRIAAHRPGYQPKKKVPKTSSPS